MNKDIYYFFQELLFDDGEIETLLRACPVLEETPFQKAFSNMTAVVSAGYPADEIGYLISQNPAFLCRNTQELQQNLQEIAKNGDIEQQLNTNPFLI